MVILGGSKGYWARKLGTNRKVASLWVQRTKGEVVGPTVESCGTHRSETDMVVQQLHRGAALPAGVFEGLWGPQKNCKNIRTMGFQSWGGRLHFVKSTSPRSWHKNQNNSWDFCLFPEVYNFDFCNELEILTLVNFYCF